MLSCLGLLAAAPTLGWSMWAITLVCAGVHVAYNVWAFRSSLLHVPLGECWTCGTEREDSHAAAVALAAASNGGGSSDGQREAGAEANGCGGGRGQGRGGPAQALSESCGGEQQGVPPHAAAALAIDGGGGGVGGKDIVSEQPERFFVAECVREQVFLMCEQEVPYCTQVVITEFTERRNAKDYVAAQIVVEKESQKGILIGRDGSMLKTTRQDARLKMRSGRRGKKRTTLQQQLAGLLTQRNRLASAARRFSLVRAQQPRKLLL
ncbi:GTPase Era, partial [Tetrabaena socialis]